MDEKEFKKLIDKKKYQVFLFKTRLSPPLAWISHCYFVINKKGRVKRYDVIYWIGKKQHKYLLLNYVPPWLGFSNSWKGYLGLVGIRHYVKLSERFESELIFQLKGAKGSIAEKMVNFIEKTPKSYPFGRRYLTLPGPNSNTFIQWIINHFPESGLKLPWNAFGKGYAKRMKT